MLSLRQLNKIVKRLPLSDNMLLLIKQGTEISDVHTVNQLSEAIAELGYTGALILVVGELSDIQGLDETTMNKKGWYKVSALRERILRNAKRKDDSEEPGERVSLPE